VLNHLDQAVQAGAELRTDVTVTGWESEAGSITVTTANGVFQSERLVITAGAWSEALLGDLGICLPVRRKHLHWYHCDDPRYRRDQGCCGFFYETPEGLFYGFPQVDDLGVKLKVSRFSTVMAPKNHFSPLRRARIKKTKQMKTQRHRGHGGNRNKGHQLSALCAYVFQPVNGYVIRVQAHFWAYYLARCSVGSSG